MLHPNNGEPAQVSHLSALTKEVVLTAGGNDARFSEVATACFVSEVLRSLGLPGTLQPSPPLESLLDESTSSSDKNYLQQPQSQQGILEFIQEQAAICSSPQTVDRINQVGSHLDRLYDAIRKAAPHARVLVMLYPNLLPQTGTGGWCRISSGASIRTSRSSNS